MCLWTFQLLRFWLCLIIWPVCCLAQAAERPNIVFFLVDDQTTNTLGCYGNEIVKTPNIDQLAQRGMRFNNAFVSHSICWVSRTTLLTGLTGRSYGTSSAPDIARPDAVKMLVSDVLRQSGYRTGYFGKWHAKMPKDYRKEDHFDEFEAIGRNPYIKTLPDGSQRHETDLIVDRGIDFIHRQTKGAPFALNLWFNACHAEDSDRRPGVGAFPWPKSVSGMYDDVEMPAPKLSSPVIFDALPSFLKTTINRERYFWRWNTPRKYQTNMRAYYRMASGIDVAIGRFVAALEAEGLADNTIIVYSADNGYHMGNRGLAGKWSHFDESLKVPLIVVDPRIAPGSVGRTSDAIALNLDLPATFLDWAGIPTPGQYQGHSLKRLVEGDKPDNWRSETYHEHFAVRNRIPAFEGLRNKQYKYACYIDHGDFEFLHDLIADPDEVVNLASDPEYAGVLTEMRHRTQARVRELGGPLDPPTAAFSPSTDAHPEAAAAVGAKLDDEGFASIFSGRSLRNWHGDFKHWSAGGGVITGQSTGTQDRAHCLTWKESTARNFDLRFEARLRDGTSCGVQYRADSRPKQGPYIATGYRFVINGRATDGTAALIDSRGRGTVACTGQRVVVDADATPWIVGSLPAGTASHSGWHEYRILVQANRHQYWIDGQKVVDVIDFAPVAQNAEGVLAFELPGGKATHAEFRAVRIRHLPDSLPLEPAESHPIPQDARIVAN